MSPKAKNILFQLLGLIISIGLLVYVFYKVDFHELGTALKDANYWWLIPNVVLIMVTMVFRAYRWQHMVEPIKVITFKRLFAITMIGFMANNVLPFRLGEFVRAYSLSNKENVSKSASLATIFVERLVFDLLMLLLIFGAVLLITPMSMIRELKVGAIATVATGLVGLLFAIYLSRRSQRESHIAKRLLGILPGKIRPLIADIIARFATGLEFMRSGRQVFWVSFHTFMIWIIMGLSNYFVFLAFGLHLPVTASFVLLVVVSILIMVPSSPGFMGVYHWGAVLSLGFYKVGQTEALSCALVMHATQYLVITLVGFYYLRREHLSLRQIERRVKSESEAES